MRCERQFCFDFQEAEPGDFRGDSVTIGNSHSNHPTYQKPENRFLMHDLGLIATLTGGLAAALVCGYVTFRLGLSPIVGYLLAGFMVGPNTPGFIANRELAEQLAEIGVILLMFGVGLQFHVKELLAVRRVALPGALTQSLVATALGTIVGVVSGWGLAAGVVFGLAVSVASTVVLMRVLVDNNDLHTPSGHIAVGWLVVEDLFTVLVLVLLPSVFSPGMGIGGIVTAVGLSTVKVAAMVALTFVVGDRVIPWLLNRVAATRSRELFTLTVLVVALGIAVGSAKVFGVSMALGAFLAGLIVGRSEFSLRAATEALPMRDAFAVLFFVSVGILFDPMHVLRSPGPVLATLAVIMIGKPLAALLLVRLMNYPMRSAVSVAIALAQIGEFSFILAAEAKALHVLDEGAVNTLIAAAIISIMLNPILYRLIDPIVSALRRFDRSEVTWNEAAPAEDIGRHAVIVGFGPVGRTLAGLLRENEVETVVVELNLDTVRALGRDGIKGIYGDATHRDTLGQARLQDAVALILSSSSMHGMPETIRVARELNPKITIFARTLYLREVDEVRAAGADVVFSGEGEVALAMTEYLLRTLGATPEQIERERGRIRSELFHRTDEDAVVGDRFWKEEIGPGARDV